MDSETKDCFIKTTIAVVSGSSIVFPYINGSKQLDLDNPHSGKITEKTTIAKDFLPNSILFTTIKTIEDNHTITDFRHFNVAKWASQRSKRGNSFSAQIKGHI